MPLAERSINIPPNHLNIMGYVNRSEVNGPGCRAVVWVQGCLRVFNPDLADQITWASDQIEVHVFKDGSRLVTGYRGYSETI